MSISLRPAAGADAATLQRWLAHPNSAFWGMGELSAAQVEEYLAGVLDGEGQDAWLGLVDGIPAFYAETYDPSLVLLVGIHDALPGDLGMHVLVAPPSGEPRHGHTDAVFAAVMRWCFDELGATRVVVEPDVRNDRIRRKNVRAGFVELGEAPVDEGGHVKTAMLSVCTRAAFESSELASSPTPLTRGELSPEGATRA